MSKNWTIETLKEYFEAINHERDKAMQAALLSAKEAVAVAEKNAEKWRENANEWRSAMNDKDRLFMQRAEFETYKEATESALKAEKERGDRGQGRSDGNKAIIGYIIAAISIAVTIIIALNR